LTCGLELTSCSVYSIRLYTSYIYTHIYIVLRYTLYNIHSVISYALTHPQCICIIWWRIMHVREYRYTISCIYMLHESCETPVGRRRYKCLTYLTHDDSLYWDISSRWNVGNTIIRILLPTYDSAATRPSCVARRSLTLKTTTTVIFSIVFFSFVFDILPRTELKYYII